MLSDTTKRQIGLARWYAQEAIVSEGQGEIARAQDEIAIACEYLSAMLGRRVEVYEASDIIALCCAVEADPKQMLVAAT